MIYNVELKRTFRVTTVVFWLKMGNLKKLREKKKTLVVINVQSLLEGTELAEKEKVTVTISVNGTDYNVDRVSPKLSSVTKEITGVGTATIQVKINNTVYGSSQTITYGDTCKFE